MLRKETTLFLAQQTKMAWIAVEEEEEEEEEETAAAAAAAEAEVGAEAGPGMPRCHLTETERVTEKETVTETETKLSSLRGRWAQVRTPKESCIEPYEAQKSPTDTHRCHDKRALYERPIKLKRALLPCTSPKTKKSHIRGL